MSKLALGPTQLHAQQLLGTLRPGAKQSGREADQLLPSCARVKKKLHLHPPDVFLACTGTLTSCLKCVRTAIKDVRTNRQVCSEPEITRRKTPFNKGNSRPELNQKTEAY